MPAASFSGNERTFWKNLVFPAQDQEIGKVERRGFDADQDVVGADNRIGHFFDVVCTRVFAELTDEYGFHAARKG